MGKSSKPWLNYKSHEDVKETQSNKLKRTQRNYKTALFYLIFLGVLGGHRFYLYDDKRAWRIFGIYLVLMIAAAFLTPFIEAAPSIVLLCYGVAIISSSYRTLKTDVEQINREIIND